MQPFLRLVALVLCVGLGARAAAPVFAETDGARFYEGDPAIRRGLADAVAARTEGGLVDRRAFSTDSVLFDGEWVFGTYLMAALGFGHLALEDRGVRALAIARMERCLDRLLEPAVRRFDTEAWHEDALESLDGDHGHAAYLGYLGVALGLHRALVPSSRFDPIHERIVDALRRRLLASPSGLIETYPDETYPIDVSSGLATVLLADRLAQRPPSIPSALEAFRRYVDPATGLLIQSIDGATGRVRDAPRGSGTALAAYFLAYVDPRFARGLAAAIRRTLAHETLGFATVDEYPPGGRARVDIDSGPIVFGAGVSATGFSLASARTFGDRRLFTHVYATVQLFGAPTGADLREGFTSGGPLGDALLFAMLTAPRAETLGALR